MLPANFKMLRLATLLLIPALLGLEMPAAPAAAAVPMRERIMEAVSATRLCPNLRVNPRVFQKIARANGMNPRRGSKDMQVLEQRVQRQVPRLLRYDRAIICNLGEYDFGPKGVIVKGLLKVLWPSPRIRIK